MQADPLLLLLSLVKYIATPCNFTFSLQKIVPWILSLEHVEIILGQVGC